MENLEFNNQYSLNDFKAMCNNNPIEVIKNPQNDKLFFQCGSQKGAVSRSIDMSKPLIISEVTGDDGKFFLLHNKNTSNIQCVL